MKHSQRTNHLFLFVVLIFLTGILPLASAEAVPQTMNYQGYLTDVNGSPVNGTVSIQFSLYNVASGPDVALWTETQGTVQVTNGVYSVILGSVTPISLSFDMQYWLGVKVGGDAEMTPRQALMSAPYAFRAKEAETVPAGSVTADRIGENCGLMQVLVRTATGWQCGSLYGAPNGVGVCIAGNCNNVGCVPGYWNIDGDTANGCEYQCTLTNNGIEVCDALDNNCDGQTNENDVCGNASAQIQAARSAADGPVSLSISGALVTYVKPTIGADPAGFFIQAESAGPALFVAVDPLSLAPEVVAAGDLVNLTITSMGTVGSLRQATSITGYARLSAGNSLAGLVQDVTNATDLVSNIDGYESEVITLNGTIMASFAASGTGFIAAQIDTAGITGSSDLRLRLPQTLNDQFGLEPGCTFTLNSTPMWRYGTTAQPSAWADADLSVTNCPAPRVISAVALSDTAVRVTFSRDILASSVLADGSQFIIDSAVAPLTVLSAVVNGNTVELATQIQISGMSYTLTAAGSVTDIFGTGVNPANNTATFPGYAQGAVLLINEFNANIANACDLAEFRVSQGGTMNGIQLWERNVTVLTFGDFLVQANDVIVVHFNGNNIACNPSTSGNETTGPTEFPSAQHVNNFDAAYDWYMPDTGMTNTDNVLTLYSGMGNIMDAVLASDDTFGTAAVASETQAAAVAAAAQWTMVAGGIPTGGFIDDNFCAHAVQDLNGTGTDALGTSIQRSGDGDTNTLSDWTMGAQSWGVMNSGQTQF